MVLYVTNYQLILTFVLYKFHYLKMVPKRVKNSTFSKYPNNTVEAQDTISIYTGGVMNKFAKSAIFHPFRDHFQIVKLVQHKCQNQLVISNIKHPKPKYLLFLGVTYIHPCLKQLRYQKKLQVTHSNGHVPGELPV